MAKSKASSSATSSDQTKVFDVAQPGKAVASQTSRPIIVSNRPILKDPMMRDESSAPELEKTEEAKIEAPSVTKTKIMPLSDSELVSEKDAPEDVKVSEPAEKTKQPDPVEESNEASLKEPTASSKPADAVSAETSPANADNTETPPAEAPADKKVAVKPPSTQESSEPEAGLDESASAESQATDENSDLKKQASSNVLAEAEAKKQAERQAELEKIVESKQYFLPINAVKKRRSSRTVLLLFLLVVILAAAGFDLALDAGVLHLNNIQPVTHFFKSKA